MWIKRSTHRHRHRHRRGRYAALCCAIDAKYMYWHCVVFTFRWTDAYSLVIVGTRNCLRPGPILIYTRILFGIKLELHSRGVSRPPHQIDILRPLAMLIILKRSKHKSLDQVIWISVELLWCSSTEIWLTHKYIWCLRELCTWNAIHFLGMYTVSWDKWIPKTHVKRAPF